MLAEFWQSIKVLLENRVVRNISLATIGTAVSQGILVAVLPLLTRLYEPSDFALLAIYTSLIGLFVVVACGRFDLAIPLPESESDGLSLLILSLLIAAVFSLLLALIYWVWGESLLTIFSLTEFQPYAWLVPLGIFLAACNLCLEYWFARTKQFGFLAKTKIARAAAGAGSQVGIGFVSRWPAGLIIGQMVFSGVGALVQGTRLWLSHGAAIQQQSIATLKRVAREYSRFPLMSGPEAIFNKIGVHVPILIIAATEGAEAGFLMIAMRIMAVPVSLLGVSVQQVYLSEAPQRHRDGNLRAFTLRMQGALHKIGTLPLLLLGVAAPFLAVPVFGADWERLGWVVLWLTPSYILQFVVSPISASLHVVNQTRYAAILQCWGAFVRVGFVAYAAVFQPQFTIEAYALSGILFYFSYLIVVERMLRRL